MMHRCSITLGILLFSVAVLGQGDIGSPDHKIALDNPLVRVKRVTVGPKEKTRLPAAAVAVFLSDGILRLGSGADRGEERRRKRGDVSLLTAGSHAVENLAFIRAGKFFDLIVMPGMIHEIHGIDVAYWFDAEARYLSEHLIGGVAKPSTSDSSR